MKRIKKASLITSLYVLTLMGIITGCEKDVYNPENGILPPIEDLFGFETRTDVNLNVDYAVPGFKAIIEVYDQNPLQDGSNLKKEGLMPIYAAYTNAESKYSGKMNIPTTVKEAYLYTNRWGLPQCVKLEATADGFKYDATMNTSSPQTRANGDYTDYFQGNAPYDLRNGPGGIVREDNLYSLCKWGANGKPESGFLSTTTAIGKVKISDLNKRVQKAFDDNTGNNANFLSTPKVTNITVPVGGAVLDVVFLSERALFKNVFGYYYYKNTYSGIPYDNYDVKRLKKYIVFPNCSFEDGVLNAGSTARLKFYGETGTSAAQDEFPEGYIIGWFFLSNGFSQTGDNTIAEGTLPGSQNGTMFTSDENNRGAGSGKPANREDRRFVALQDKVSNILVYGFEDQMTPDAATEDYSDVLFAVVSDADITSPEERPEIPDLPEDEDVTFTVSGTVAFEDIWPDGGDYDLNDVIIEYSRKITFDVNNIATKVVETFKPVQPAGSAVQDNFFACAYKNLGTMTVPNGVKAEAATNSFVIQTSAKQITSGTEFTIERDLTGLGLSQTDVVNDFNPYIITKEYTTSDRVEVHLPKAKWTNYADQTLMNAKNAYYIGGNGKYPYAILIPITGFVPADEQHRIDSEGQYPRFSAWAESNGTTNEDWYVKKGK